jgi:dipeptidyl aminopeptidase/acylaminoacyl peptidase
MKLAQRYGWGCVARLVTPLATATAFPLSAQVATQPLAVEDALARVALVPPLAVTPDGEWVAYTLQDGQALERRRDQSQLAYSGTGAPSGLEGSVVWVVNTRTGEARRVSEDAKASWGPAWSPDGGRLAFYSDRGGEPRLWVWDLRTHEARQVSEVVVRPLFSWELPVWLPDGRKVLLKALPSNGTTAVAAQPPPRGPLPMTGSADDSGSAIRVFEARPRTPGDSESTDPGGLPPLPWVDESRCDLVSVELSTGKVQRIAEDVRVKGYLVSPDGELMTYSHYVGRSPVRPLDALFDITVTSLVSGASKSLARGIPQGFFGRSFAWSPSGSALSFTVGAAPSSRDPRIGENYLIFLQDSVPRKSTSASHPPFAGITDHGDDDSPPLWDPAGRFLYFVAADTIWRVDAGSGVLSAMGSPPNGAVTRIIAPAGKNSYWSPDGGRSMYFRSQDRQSKRIGTYHMDIESGRISRRRNEARAFGTREQLWTAAAERADVVAYVAEDAGHDQDIWVARKGFTQVQRLTHLNPRIEGYRLGTTRLIEWRSTDDGRRLQGVVLLPPGYRPGVRYPMIVNVYGGLMRSGSLNHFGLVGPGVDNMQVFATRGFVVLAPDAPYRRGATLMRDLASSILPGVTKAIELGLADPDRIGVMGHSFGAYTTLALLVQTRLFKAAVASAATGDLISTFGSLHSGSTQWVESGQLGMDGTPWTVRERYVENSPLYYLDRIRTPLLLLHGGRDLLRSELAEEVFVGLHHLGSEVTYVKYEGEDHYPGEWGYPNQVDYLNRVIRWFEEHLPSGPPAADDPCKPRDRQATSSARGWLSVECG